MQSLTRTATVTGNDASIVSIECLNTSGFAGLQLVGNTGELCREGKERAKSVLEALGYKMGHKRILINFSPADERKEGNHFDLPIAVSLAAHLATSELAIDPSEWLFAAELGLNGDLRSSRGLVPLILAAIEQGLKGVVASKVNLPEIQALKGVAEIHVKDFRYVCFEHIKEVIGWLQSGVRGTGDIAANEISAAEHTTHRFTFDDMYLTEDMQRLALATAVGGHSLILRGPPGSGKSMFAQRLPSLMPRLNRAKHLEALRIHSLSSEKISPDILKGYAPFRAPHHSSSAQALLGTAERPGEMSLAHGGLLFLDELPEFRRDVLEGLREPLETGMLHIARAHKKSTWKAKVQFIAACNNCPCGYYDSKRHNCGCSSKAAQIYKDRMSGPLLERIDIHCWLVDSDPRNLVADRPEQSREMIARCESAREFMERRWGPHALNSEATFEAILETSSSRGPSRNRLAAELGELKISSRSALKALRIARTLADLDACEIISPEHLKAAAQWRRLRIETSP